MWIIVMVQAAQVVQTVLQVHPTWPAPAPVL